MNKVNRHKYKMDMLEIALDAKMDWDALQTGVTEASRDYIIKIQEGGVKLAKQKVGVKTGRTKASIEVKHKAKYTMGWINTNSWIDKWIEDGKGGYYGSLNKQNITEMGTTGRSYRKWYHNQKKNKHKKIAESKMLKSHPAYYMYRPFKQLVASSKSNATFERYMKEKLKGIEIK